MPESNAHKNEPDTTVLLDISAYAVNGNSSESVVPDSHDKPTGTDLASLLEDSENLVVLHENRVSEVESKVKELRDAMAKFDLWREKRVSRLETVKKVENPYDNLQTRGRFTSETLVKLVTLEVITAEKADQILKLYELIDKLKSVKAPAPEIMERLAKLEAVEKDLNLNLNDEVLAGGGAFEERRRTVREKVLDHHNKRTGAYGQRIKALEKDPLVTERMERDAFVTEVRRNVQSIATRLKMALDNLAKALDDKNFTERLLKILDLEGNAQRMHVYNLRADLSSAVRSRDIANPGSVVPWKSKTGNKYLEIMRSLNNRELMQKVKATGDEDLMKRMDNIFDTEDCLRRVLGREHDGMANDRNGKPIKKQKSEFWRAFEQREEK